MAVSTFAFHADGMYAGFSNLDVSGESETNYKVTRSVCLALDRLQIHEIERLIGENPDFRNLILESRHEKNALHYLMYSYTKSDSALRPSQSTIRFMDMLSLLTGNGFDINEGCVGRQTSLHIVASRPGYFDILKLLIGCGAKVNVLDTSNQSPLHKSVMYGNIMDIQTLLENQADVHALDATGHGPLHLAAKRPKSVNIMILLLDSGAKVNEQEIRRHHKGQTPLHVACRYGRFNNIDFLLRRGASPDITDGAGNNCFHLAATWDVTGKVLQILLRACPYGQSSLNVKDDICGETALHKAVKYNMHNNVKMLMQYNAHIQSVDVFGESVLHRAATYANDYSISAMLAKAGCDVTITNIRGQTARDKAVKAKNDNALAVLKQYDKITSKR